MLLLGKTLRRSSTTAGHQWATKTVTRGNLNFQACPTWGFRNCGIQGLHCGQSKQTPTSNLPVLTEEPICGSLYCLHLHFTRNPTTLPKSVKESVCSSTRTGSPKQTDLCKPESSSWIHGSPVLCLLWDTKQGKS